jgi:hypothetical protein
MLPDYVEGFDIAFTYDASAQTLTAGWPDSIALYNEISVSVPQ